MLFVTLVGLVNSEPAAEGDELDHRPSHRLQHETEEDDVGYPEVRPLCHRHQHRGERPCDQEPPGTYHAEAFDLVVATVDLVALTWRDDLSYDTYDHSIDDAGAERPPQCRLEGG